MRAALLISLALLLLAIPASAASVVNGVTLISQADALAGRVTSGDAAGFPITISQTGTYRLIGNIVPPAGQNGFGITAPEVTLDLAGFTITGNGRAASGVIGVSRSLTVMNGTIRGFLYDAIYAGGPLLMVDKMRLADNGRYGINEVYVNASPKTGQEDGQTTIKNSIIFRNAQGITCQSGCHIEGNVISHSTYSAIVISQPGATVINNTISNNGGNGVVGNYIGLSNNTIFNNAYCHTSGVMLIGTRNMIFPTSRGTNCTPLSGN